MKNGLNESNIQQNINNSRLQELSQSHFKEKREKDEQIHKLAKKNDQLKKELNELSKERN